MPAKTDQYEPRLEKAGGNPIVYIPEPGSTMGRMLDPRSDADEIRTLVGKYAKKTKRDAEWIASKLSSLGLAATKKPKRK